MTRSSPAPTAGSNSPERALLRPERLFTAAEVRERDCPIPKAAGVYAWYFDAPPVPVPVGGCHVVDGWTLLYVGISPKSDASRQTIRSRIRYHYRGNAYGSTLRLTLGCLLADEIGIGLRRVGSGTRLTFGADGEARLSAWMAEHARVVWVVTGEPWLLEERLIREQTLPLNLDQNRHSPFHQQLSALRAEQRARARQGPIP
ncbi:hypothetical protein JIG36_48065 [Actinoplanes sp. LDG1-06]|uniref:GIY-YIG catalytic domain-containing protein n=1 Tax=Paractinoplanes ovalisporus TaxID=2810368 RepID=A0ABS2ATS6_9ACTN|nr:hypothetical protein [Actinoplanes ovalisporus]MBM2623280.1 hypothetical protein [Actinoplanes ovalisporus]